MLQPAPSCADVGHGDDTYKDEPGQVRFPQFTGEARDIPKSPLICIEDAD